jgi:hypothetical protein
MTASELTESDLEDLRTLDSRKLRAIVESIEHRLDVDISVLEIRIESLQEQLAAMREERHRARALLTRSKPADTSDRHDRPSPRAKPKPTTTRAKTAAVADPKPFDDSPKNAPKRRK